jgi:hypothetical protein
MLSSTIFVLFIFVLMVVLIHWVWYEIGRDNTVKLIEYIPYAEVKNDATQKNDEMTSL